MKIYVRMILVLLAISFFLFGSVKAEGNQSVELISYFDSDNQVETDISGLDYGARVSVSNQLSSRDNYSFYLWIYNGVIRPDLPLDYSFVVSSNTEIIGIFRPNNQYVALFVDANGKRIDVQYVSPGGNATDIDSELLPDKPGYEIATIKWNKSLTNIQTNTIFILQYQKVEASSYNVTVSEGTGSGTYGFNEYATVVANEPGMGMYFSYWMSNGKIMSYESTYTFTVLDDVSIEAVYASEPSVTLPLISLSGNLALRIGYHTYLGQFFLPEGFDLIEYGLITSSEEGMLDLGSSSFDRHQGSRYNPLTNEFVMSIPEANLNSVRAYLVVKDDLGNLRTFYDEYFEGVEIGTFASDLFFSYYIEGTSFNKALGIYNGTGSTIDLSQYSINLYSNGASIASANMSLSGQLAHGDVYVVSHGSANATILAMANATNSSVINFNGDDAIVLVKGSSVVDSIGQVGYRPSTEWGSGLVSTADNTLKRKASVSSGRTASTSAFDPSVEWDGYATDHSVGLNQHTMTGGSAPVTVTSIEAFIDVDTYEQGESIDLTGAFIKVFYSDGTSSVMSMTSEMVSSFSTSLVGTHSFAITYQGKSTALYYVVTALTSSHTLMIYEVYGGGGNTGAIYKYDYVVLYNG
ncbi:MAG: lamin tail domain-containing protein, partial [Candidatus Izemoplasmatales bacterium]|nr:lamin tail domain-containing protein [Candidatus Izemoplasmatales bacterium]